MASGLGILTLGPYVCFQDGIFRNKKDFSTDIINSSPLPPVTLLLYRFFSVFFKAWINFVQTTFNPCNSSCVSCVLCSVSCVLCPTLELYVYPLFNCCSKWCENHPSVSYNYFLSKLGSLLFHKYDKARSQFLSLKC